MFVVVSFSATSTCISLPLLSLSTPVDGRSFGQLRSATVVNDIKLLLLVQTIYVKFISMNYENSYVYLCFCCADAVDCGVGWMICMGELYGYGLGVVLSCCRPALWILDQVQYDGP